MLRKTFSLSIALAFILMACSGPPQAAPDRAAKDGAPRPGGTLNVRVPSDPFDWDMSYQGKTGPNLDGLAMAYESLLTFKNAPGIAHDELIPQGELAERWEISPDAKTFTFHLRKGVKFANQPPVNGRELTSADVKWSFEYWARTAEFKSLPAAQFDFMFQGMDAIETPDPSTVVVRFQQPYIPFLTFVATDRLPIVPHEIYDLDGHLKNRVVGTGPWQLDEAASQKGSRWVWKKNPTYWDPARPYIDEVRWLVIPDDSSAVAAFRAKQVDWLSQNLFTYQGIDDLVKSYPDAQIHKYYQTGAYHIHWQTQRPPLNDVRLRRAIALAINRDELSLVEQGEPGLWAVAGAHRGVFTDEESKQIVRYDPVEARRLVAEAFPDGVELTWDFPGKVYGEQYITRIQLLQDQLKKVGITVNLKSVDNAEFSAKRKAKDFTINLAATDCGDDFDHDSHVYACYHSKAKNNYAALNDPELDRLLEAQRREIDPAQRRDLIRSIAQRLNDEVMTLDLYYPARWQVTQSYLKNFAPHRGLDGVPVRDSWLEK